MSPEIIDTLLNATVFAYIAFLVWLVFRSKT